MLRVKRNEEFEKIKDILVDHGIKATVTSLDNKYVIATVYRSQVTETVAKFAEKTWCQEFNRIVKRKLNLFNHFAPVIAEAEEEFPCVAFLFSIFEIDKVFYARSDIEMEIRENLVVFRRNILFFTEMHKSEMSDQYKIQRAFKVKF